ncbi:MAG: DUF6396 domain-containing protein [Haemophilus parainfluenzae]|nr:DUF6396 domain-containing protein [uncultured Haemophilus sp.]MDU4703026.1 DUF6396 domain-containing protein [Haemophilus parainfluenzae]
MISDYLSDNDISTSKVPDLDDIVLLLPTRLPNWDGKIVFQYWFEGELH